MLLLVPSSTYRARDFLDAARKLGVEVVVASEEPHVMSELMGVRSLSLPLADPQAAAAVIVDHDRGAPIDAVVALDDQGTLVAAEASRNLGIPHNPPEAVAAARDKLLMRTMLERAEVQQPAFGTIPQGASDEEVARLVTEVGLPCVIKPTTLAASQGVLRADSSEEAVRVKERVRRISEAAGLASSEPLLVERFVTGPEVAVEGLLRDGTLDVLAIFDKPDPLDGPAFEETIYVTPSRLDDSDTKAVVGVAQAATSALGLEHGPVHAELRVSDARASLIEVAARTIGGLCSRTLSFSTGRTLEEIVLSEALGMSPERPELVKGASGVLMLPIPRAGSFEGLGGVAEALAVPGVTDVETTLARGRHVDPVPEGNRYVGFVFARSKTPEQVEKALRRARSLIEVKVLEETG